MLMTGIITGADTGVVYIRGEYPLAVRRVREAVSQIEEAGIATGTEGDAIHQVPISCGGGLRSLHMRRGDLAAQLN